MQMISFGKVMTKPQQLYVKIKQILRSYFKEDLREMQDGWFLEVGDSGLWVAGDERELTVGYGPGHAHYGKDDLKDALVELFLLLTKPVKITEYKKGDYVFKTRTEFDMGDGEFYDMGVVGQLLYPYWKKTKERVYFENPLIEEGRINEDFKKLEKEIE